MDHEQVRIVITGLFSQDGRLAHYREQYSVAIVDAFCSEKADSLADKVIRALEEQFKAHANASEAVMRYQQTANLPVDLQDDESRSIDPPAVDALPEQAVPAGARINSAEAATASVVEQQTSISDPTSTMKPVPESKAASSASSSQLPTTGSAMPRKFSFRLKGGKLQVGVPYDGRIEAFDGAPNAVAQVLSVQIPPELGLAADESDPAHLTGTPKASGDTKIDFSYRIAADGADKMTLNSSVTVFVNHDPKSLWKDLRSDQTDPHWKPDTDTAVLRYSDRVLVAASKRGRSHAHEGKFRDDDFRVISSATSGWVIVAVADGAGSAAKSRLGSKIAVTKAVDVLLEKLEGPDGIRLEESVAGWKRGEVSRESVVSAGLYPVLGIAAFEACKALEAEAGNLGVLAKELSTTLLVTAYKPTDFGHVFATYWVGDGGAGVYLKDGSVRLLGKADSGEFAGQTRFLDNRVMTTEEIAARLNFTVVDDFKALIVMTDGITDPYFTTDNNLESGDYWGKLWAEIEPALESETPDADLLAWLDFWSAGNHDDRTIAVLW